MNQKEFRVYNMILPIWLLLWFPSPLWLLLIPANFLLDLLVIWLSIRKEENGFAVAWKNSGKICIAGFVSDFIGIFGRAMLKPLKNLIMPLSLIRLNTQGQWL